MKYGQYVVKYKGSVNPPGVLDNARFAEKGDVSDYLFTHLEVYEAGMFEILYVEDAGCNFPHPREYRQHQADILEMDNLDACPRLNKLLARTGSFEERAGF